MSGQAWLVDSNRIATKIKSASGAYDPAKVQWTSNPTKSCPNCQFEIDNNDVPHAWPGLPRGVKFDPTDQEIIWHLLAKVGVENVNSHPFIDEFIPTVEEVGGICYTHPQNLPGVKQDGSVAHFFHRAIKAYSTGTRKRRKIHGDDCGDVRWHKTGRTKPVVIDGVQKGCKKIMVLYVSPIRGGKAEKTNWVMHQYHLGAGEDEKEGEYVLSKVFYQQQAVKHIERGEEEISDGIDTMTAKVDPVTPKSVTPEPRAERRFSEYVSLEDSTVHTIEHIIDDAMEDELEAPTEQSNDQNQNNVENYVDQVGDQGNGEADQVRDQGNDEADHAGDQGTDEADEGGDQGTDEADEGGDQGNDEASQVLWDSQMFMNSQQLVEGLSICDEFFESQSPNRDEAGGGQGVNRKPRLADYARLGPEDLKRDLEECQNLASDTENIDIDTPPDFRLSQLEFASQDSYIAWGGSFQGGRVID